MNIRWFGYRGMSLVLISAMLLGAVLSGFSSGVLADDYVLISNKKVPIKSLSKTDVQSIFLGERSKWDDGSTIEFAVMDSGDFHKSFLQNVIGKTQSQFDAYWMRMVFAGKARPLKPYSEVQEVIKFVATHPGAIGYVPVGEAGTSVKAIAIN